MSHAFLFWFLDQALFLGMRHSGGPLSVPYSFPFHVTCIPTYFFLIFLKPEKFTESHKSNDNLPKKHIKTQAGHAHPLG